MDSNSSSSTSITMIPWLHFGNADYLVFKAWRPSSHGAIAGACVGLFLFCIFERCLAAYRRSQELRWRAQALVAASRLQSRSGKDDNVEVSEDVSVPPRRRLAPSFVPSRDISRGVIEAIQSIFSYVLMLAVMTFNAAYILSIIIGLGVGEVLVGRIGRRKES